MKYNPIMFLVIPKAKAHHIFDIMPPYHYLVHFYIYESIQIFFSFIFPSCIIQIIAEDSLNWCAS